MLEKEMEVDTEVFKNTKTSSFAHRKWLNKATY